MLRQPDGPSGLASVRAGYGLVRSPYTTLTKLQRQFGRVFCVGQGPLSLVYMVGPEANRFLMRDAADNFCWREAFEMLTPIAGETALIVSDGAAHDQRRQLIRVAFRAAYIDACCSSIAAETRAAIARWRPGRVVDIYASLRAVVRRVVTRVLFGDELASMSADIGRQLEVLLAYVNDHPLWRFGPDFPGTRLRRAKRARAALDELIYAAIDRRRARHPTPRGAEQLPGDDLLARLLEAGLTEIEIRDQIVSLITAGYDTTSAAVGWTLLALLRRPELWQRVAREVDELEAVAEATARSGSWLDAVVCESLRLFPPVAQGGRKAIEAFEFAGHRIAAGALVMHSPYLTHRLAEIWPDPDRFEPRRWLPGQGPGRTLEPYAYLPFGGGARRCVGASLATAIIRIVVAEVVARTRLRLLPQTCEPTGLSVMTPKHGILVRVEACAGLSLRPSARAARRSCPGPRVA